MSDWIEWSGGECPVDAKVLVETKWSDGQPCPVKEARKWRWEHLRARKGDEMPMPNLIAYKVI